MDQNLDTIVQVKLPSGQVLDIVDWSDLPIFSAADLQAGCVLEELDFFQYVVGGQVPSATQPGGPAAIKRTASEVDTNVATAGQMTTNEELLVYAIKPEVFMFTTPTINDFTSRSILVAGDDGSEPVGMPSPGPECLSVLNQQTLLRLTITEKVKAEAGFGYFNTGFGVFHLSEGSVYANAGVPSQEAVRSYVLPHHIGSQEKFRVQLINPTGEALEFGVVEGEGGRDARQDVMATIRINLDGLYKRPTA